MSTRTSGRAKSAQPNKVYNPEIYALSNLIQQASNHLEQNKSKSYASKLRDRQASRKSTSRDYDRGGKSPENYLETPKNWVPPEPLQMTPSVVENGHPGHLPLQCKQDSGSDKSMKMQDRISTVNPSDISYEKLSVDKDNLLSIVRDTEPKAEFRTPSYHYISISSKNSSPERGGYISFKPKDVQYLVNLEKKLTEQRIKYKKLEQKYKELLAKNSRSEEFYENAIQKLSYELNQLKGKTEKESRESPTQKVEENPIFKILSEIESIKIRLTKIENGQRGNKGSLL
ncbi:unnamed protein product [Blepharisma stoltei]|uniref:Uncharacterized protein n=1 Tax=Blepharisma stoltei TaxID=1481888 RepID=A0AAU9K8L4_9CILI|nr:unnamed protein product [Blepharisma stoltei]